MEKIEIESLRNQLFLARNEINRLRQHIKSFTYAQQREIEKINLVLKNFRCENCRPDEKNKKKNHLNPKDSSDLKNNVNFRPIGVIRTQFSEKRAVPRQSAIGNRLKSRIELDSCALTNPEHAVQELNDFSHLWIIYYFHKNKSHSKAKVSPPRLYGKRVGVFSTRSPHRPCPIGLSLVKIHSIDKSTIQFYGTDMVDGTPVLDIKPYIPYYDNPMILEEVDGPSLDYDSDVFCNSKKESNTEKLNLCEAKTVAVPSTIKNKNLKEISQLSTYKVHDHIKIPNWITSKHLFQVVFSEDVNMQLNQLEIDKNIIVHIFRNDPRSLYLRTKYSCEKFTFKIGKAIVTCQFDDKNFLANVIQIKCSEDYNQ